MGIFRRRSRRLSIASVSALLFLLFASANTDTAVATLATTHRKLGSGMKEEGEDSSGSSKFLMTGRRLSGLGSSPPSCRSKCDRCSPCKPVHVPVHPGLTIPLEYYPEAWRCKCGNKLYMP